MLKILGHLQYWGQITVSDTLPNTEGSCFLHHKSVDIFLISTMKTFAQASLSAHFVWADRHLYMLIVN